MLTEPPEEIFLRFERPKTVWFELAYIKSRRRFLGFRCNAFEKDPDWQPICVTSQSFFQDPILDTSGSAGGAFSTTITAGFSALNWRPVPAPSVMYSVQQTS